MALSWLVLVACSGTPDPTVGSGLDDSVPASPPSETATPTDSVGPPVHRWHALLSSDGQLSKQHPPLVELDSDLSRVWGQDFGGERGRGAQGIDRDAAGRTVYTRVDGDVEVGWVDLLDPDGAVIWQWDGASVGGLHFPHAVVFTPAGDLIVADTAASRLLSVDLDGQLLWEEPLPSTSPNGLDLWVDDGGAAHLLMTGRHVIDGDAGDSEELVNRYLLGDRDGSPALVWSRTLGSGPSAGESPHGPALLEDGTALYCARGKGQLVQLDGAGDEIWRSEEDSDLLSQPQDVVLVDDALLVVERSLKALIRIEDPFGAFEHSASHELAGVFGVKLVWCGDDGGLPCRTDE